MNRVLADGLRKLANQFGYDVVPLWRQQRLGFANHLSKLFSLLNVDCVLDVGANSGQYRDFLRMEVGFEERIISFEPIPELYADLHSRAGGDNKWEVSPYALGLVEGQVVFNIMANSEFSSFLSPDHSVISRFRDLNRVDRQVSAQMRTLSSMLPELRTRLGIARPYLKLDTQGYDLNVIKGAGQRIREFAGLQTEAAVRPLYQGAPLFSDVFREVEERGFLLSATFPNNEGHFPTLIEFDAVFFNEAMVSDQTASTP